MHVVWRLKLGVQGGWACPQRARTWPVPERDGNINQHPTSQYNLSPRSPYYTCHLTWSTDMSIHISPKWPLSTPWYMSQDLNFRLIGETMLTSTLPTNWVSSLLPREVHPVDHFPLPSLSLRLPGTLSSSTSIPSSNHSAHHIHGRLPSTPYIQKRVEASLIPVKWQISKLSRAQVFYKQKKPRQKGTTCLTTQYYVSPTKVHPVFIFHKNEKENWSTAKHKKEKLSSDPHPYFHR